MGKGREREPQELVAVIDDPNAAGGDHWSEDGEARTRFSVGPLHIGLGLALFAVAVIVPVAAAGLTWLAFERGRS